MFGSEMIDSKDEAKRVWVRGMDSVGAGEGRRLDLRFQVCKHGNGCGRLTLLYVVFLNFPRFVSFLQSVPVECVVTTSVCEFR